MTGRKILDGLFVLLVIAIGVAFAAELLYQSSSNYWSCDSSVPSNFAQSAALDDARSRWADVCLNSQRVCTFSIQAESDGTVRISLYLSEKHPATGCIYKGQDADVFVYSREGKFLRTDEAPFG
ncbi:hypothetical protein HNQ60_001263 [Povalibacter uvarum]|uniref:Uncharacterized protein n=2 Tax=Povalibacter uvarum TaxID=732238 RepID=A0A841HHH9_9GAMM|nr:hypothetical protein [Povalibacter uvarum]